MRKSTIETVLSILDQTYPSLPMHEIHGHDPFHLLIAVLLSQRSRDQVVVPLASRLFSHYPTPQAMDHATLEQIQQLIKPAGFYVGKAAAIKAISKILIEKYDGKVPSLEADLLSLPGVGRKTANIVLTSCFNTPQIAVDIHVHRITHRLGWVTTTTVLDTEIALTRLIPPRFHAIVNRVFVAHGQTLCLPRSPHCSRCPIAHLCPRLGVINSQ